jgi:hypothetical protein
LFYELFEHLQPFLSIVTKPRLLREENAKLKRLVADLSLDKVMLQDVVPSATPSSDAPRGPRYFRAGG